IQGKTFWGLDVVHLDGQRLDRVGVVCLYDNTGTGCPTDHDFEPWYWFANPTLTPTESGDGTRRDLILQTTVGRLSADPSDIEKCPNDSDAWDAKLDAVKRGEIKKGERQSVRIVLRNSGTKLTPDATELARVKDINPCMR